MDWIDLAWTMMCTAALSLSAIHLLVWFKRRDRLAHLAFALAGLSLAAAGLIEVSSFRAETASEYAALVRWYHVPMFIALVSLMLFVRWQFNAGRLWLVILFCVLRLAVLAANFGTGVNLQFTEISGLHPLSLFGARIVAPMGVANPWMLLGHASMLVFVAFMIDAVIEVRREPQREDRRSATRILASIVFFVALSVSYVAFAVINSPMPLLVIPPFMVVLLVMGYELGIGMTRSYELADHLRASELGLSLSGERTLMGAWSYRIGSGEFHASPQARALLGFGEDDAIDGDALWAIIHQPDRASVEAAMQAARDGNAEFKAEFRVADSNVEFRSLVAVGRREFRQGADTRLVQGVLVDITERRRLEARFRQVVEASPVGKLVVEKDGRIDFANAAAGRIFGYPTEQLCQMNIDALVPTASRGRHAAQRDAYARDSATRRMGEGRELCGLHRDGHEVPVEIGLAAIPSDHGLQFLATITDISERKQREREAALQREELAHLSRVALLSELSGSLAHELNQPLTAILSNAQAALRYMTHTPPNLEEVRESLVNIVESDKRAGEVIRRLRAMLRKDPPDFQSLDVNEVVQDVLRIIRSDLLNRSVVTHLVLAQDLPPIRGDRVQLQQVILNLLINGADAMADNNGGRVLAIRSQLLPSGGVEVQVSDVGKGIPEADLERIFSAFVTSKSEGMGLGLAVCTTIMQAHRGRLWASNNAGPGATLHLELPVQAP
ncbi:MAG TPA: PAS domain S-box protein [Thermomonas sp.]|jgi:PAS domain S-box-containing protein|nr:PAS domain S-box protein [Thermomonas sp.]